MVSACILLFGGLVNIVAQSPSSGVGSPVVSCNKQGTVFNTSWINGFTNASSAQVVLNGTVIWTASPTAQLIYPADAPACPSDTDDTSSTDPNCAVSWAVTVTVGQAQYNYPFCSVNGQAPFQVGIYPGSNPPQPLQANNAYVALRRTAYTYEGQSVIVVAVAFNEFSPQADCPVYGQVFYVDPSTGQPVSGGSSSPMILNSWLVNPITNPNNYHEAGTLAIGGISGDDYGNFVVSYVRQYLTEYSNPVGIYVSTITPSATPGVIEALVSSPASQYCWSRVACYHGSSAIQGGFVVAATPNGNDYINTYRCTTNWSNSAPVVATNYTSNANSTYQFPGTQSSWQFSIACERDTQGNYMVTWPTIYDPPPYNNDPDNIGVNNIAYQLFSGDSTGSVIQLTYYYGTHSYYGGNTPPPDSGNQPSVAVCDKSYGGNAHIVFVETPYNSGVGTLVIDPVSGP
jgi:hypothetical protein